MKLCKNCIHYEVESERCNKQPDFITGEAIPSGKGWRGSPRLQRDEGFISSFIMNACGTRGRWFIAIK